MRMYNETFSEKFQILIEKRIFQWLRDDYPIFASDFFRRKAANSLATVVFYHIDVLPMEKAILPYGIKVQQKNIYDLLWKEFFQFFTLLIRWSETFSEQDYRILAQFLLFLIIRKTHPEYLKGEYVPEKLFI